MVDFGKDWLTFLSVHDWLLKASLMLLFGIVGQWILSVFRKRLTPVAERTGIIWGSEFISAVYAPTIMLMWLLIVSLLIPLFFQALNFDKSYLKYLPNVRELIFLIAVLWFALRFIRGMENHLMQKSEEIARIKDKTTIRAVSQLIRVTVIILALLIAMQTMGLSIATLLTLGGVGGIAIGFAAKDTLANFLGGMMIFWDRPFCVGDWIRSPDREIEGTVESIGWRLTRIRTFDKRPLFVPNGVFSSISIENPQRMTHRRIKVTVGLRYDDATKVNIILKDVEKMLRHHPEIDANQTLMVNLFEFGPSSLNFFIYTFTKTTEWVRFQAVQQDVFLKVIEIITAHGAECAFPTTTLHVPNGLNLREAKGELLYDTAD